MSDKSKLEFMIRVKLPQQLPDFCNPRTIDPSPECRKWQDEIFVAKPYGFEVSWPQDGLIWPVDSDGYTYVPLYISTTEGGALNVWIDRYHRAADRLRQIDEKALELSHMAKHY